MTRPKMTRAARRVRKAVAKAKPDPLDGLITAGAKALELSIDKTWMPAVRTHLRVTLAHGAKVAGFTLPDGTEPAPVFKA